MKNPHENTIPESKEIKDKLITSAEVIYATTLDNGASVEFGIDQNLSPGKKCCSQFRSLRRQYKHANGV